MAYGLLYVIIHFVDIQKAQQLSHFREVLVASFCVWLFADCAYADILDVANGQVGIGVAKLWYWF